MMTRVLVGDVAEEKGLILEGSLHIGMEGLRPSELNKEKLIAEHQLILKGLCLLLACLM